MSKFNKVKENPDTRINSGHWDKSPRERAEITERACERAGVSNFHDLSSEERAAAYDGGHNE
jgi:hypothetical protein